MGACGSTRSGSLMTPKEKKFRRAIKLYEVNEVASMTNLFNRNKYFASGELPLTLAAKEGHEAVVEALIDGGADCNKLDKNGSAPLHIAVHINDAETVEILLDHGASANKFDGNDNTPLHIACERGLSPLVKILLNGGAEANGNPERGVPPLISALNNSHPECVKYLLKKYANPDCYDTKGNPAIYLAVVNSDAKSTELLVNHNVDIYAPNRTEEQLLCVAAMNANPGVIRALLQAGADPNLYKKGEEAPPLIAATVKGCSESVDLLLEATAEVNISDKRNQTALFHAVMSAVDYEKEMFYSRYFSNVYRQFTKFDPEDISVENSIKCAISLVQAGADVSKVWQKFAQIFPHPKGISFEQMVLCEVLVQTYGFQDLPLKKARTFVTNLLSLREYALTRLLFSAGVDPVTEDLYLLSVRSEDPDKEMFRWVKRLKCNPRQLKDLCRKKIRRILSWNVLFLVEKLDSPSELKNYVCITDTEYYSKVPEDT